MRKSVEEADELLLRNEARARRNRSMVPVMRLGAQRSITSDEDAGDGEDEY